MNKWDCIFWSIAVASVMAMISIGIISCNPSTPHSNYQQCVDRAIFESNFDGAAKCQILKEEKTNE